MNEEIRVKYLICRKCDKFVIHRKTKSGLYKCVDCGEERPLKRLLKDGGEIVEQASE